MKTRTRANEKHGDPRNPTMPENHAPAGVVRPARRNLSSAEVLGTLGVVCAGYFLATVVVLHLIQPELNPIDHAISEYALGPSGWLMTLAFLVVGAGVVALGLGLRRSLTPGRHVWAAWLIVLTGLFAVGVGVFTIDVPLADGTTGHTFSGQMHLLAGTAGPLILLVGAFVLRGVFARDPRWHPLAQPTGWFAVAMTLWFLVAGAFAIAMGPGGSYSGLVQRIFWLIMAGWFALIGWRMRRLGPAPTAA